MRRAGPARAGVLLHLSGVFAATTLDEMLDEIIAWIGEAIKHGTI